MDDQDYKSIILYYGREKLYHSMQTTALDGMTRFSGNLIFRLFNGMALILGNRIQEGIRELNPIQSEKEYGMAAILALLYAHKHCGVVDKEALLQLDNRLKEERKKLSAVSSYYSAIFLFFSGKLDKAKEYADKSLKYNPESADSLALRGWTELCLSNRVNKNVLEIFEKSVSIRRSIDAHLGQVKYYQSNSDFEMAISVLNKLSVRYPELNIPLVEKMKTQLSSWNWEHAVETSSRILNIEPSNIDALRIKILVALCRDANYELAINTLQFLYKAMAKNEPTNSVLYLQIAQLFSRTCGRNPNVLAECQKFIEKAAKMSPGNADYITELGYQFILQSKYKDATKVFRTATKIDDSSILALCGLTYTQLMQSSASEQVNQQIEFLSEIQGTSKIPLLLYMTARYNHDKSDDAIRNLIEACEIQFKNLKTLPFGTEYLRIFNADFLLQLTKELLNHSPVQPDVNTLGVVIPSRDSLHVTLLQSLNILMELVKACPGLVEGVYQLARVQFLSGEITTSIATLQKILQELDPTYMAAHLLIAQIHIQQKYYNKAAQSLEICLSHNFKVRENPSYHLLYGIILKSQQQYDDCVKSFLTAMSLSGINYHSTMSHTITKSDVSPSKGSSKLELNESNSLSLADKVTLYLELINAYTSMGQISEANKLMQNAITEFCNTPEEGRLIISNAELYLEQGNVNQALDLLTNIKPNQLYYLQAKTKMAHIYLNKRKDRILFAQCFKELVRNCPGSNSYLMLGDACMSIQEPDEAIEAYIQAFKQNPSDALLASKLGRSYVKTHQYKKAISYYQEAIQNPENYALKLDLAELFLKLKQFSNAEQTLVDEIASDNNANEDISMLQTRTKQLLLLARIREKAGLINSSISTLKEARDNQYRVQKRLIIEPSSSIQEQHNILSKICILMAEQSMAIRDHEHAIQHYEEALKFLPDDSNILAALAKIHLQMNNMDQCQQRCAIILQSDPNNEAASVMMADLSFRKIDFENAAYHFSQLLVAQPTYWTALARLIEVMRRSGTLIDIESFLQRAEQSCFKPDSEAGLNYCKGLNEWYTGNPNSALRYFNNSRRDIEWGQQSIFNMIEICLNPDADLPIEGVVESPDELDYKDSRTMALKTAERLLKELKPRPGGMDNEALNHRLLENFHLLASRQKYQVERALQDFTVIASQEEYKENVGSIYGISSAYVILKQPQRAKNQLKRIAKNIWTFEEAEYLERCWLLLADLYIQSNKQDIAQNLIQRVIQHNKSCTKAYELFGVLSEKENIRTATVYYDLAWRYGGKTKPNIGYKLAYNYMKIKRYADAIDICQQVLKVHPDYPSIKKEILDKCRNNLKS